MGERGGRFGRRGLRVGQFGQRRGWRWILRPTCPGGHGYWRHDVQRGVRPILECDNSNANGGSALSYIPETVWNDSTTGDPAAGGGGASTVFAQPAWQTGLGVPNNGARNVPDIALKASADHDGYLVYSGGQLPVYGGTSAGTPAFAGITALLNHYLVASGAQSAAGVGNVNPRLYALAQAGTGVFHDVTSGEQYRYGDLRQRARELHRPGTWGYAAGQGYDQASGLGSVDAYNLVTSGTWRRARGGRRRCRGAGERDVGGVDGFGDGDGDGHGGGGETPTGTVTFSAGGKQIGTATLSGSGSHCDGQHHGERGRAAGGHEQHRGAVQRR